MSSCPRCSPTTVMGHSDTGTLKLSKGTAAIRQYLRMSDYISIGNLEMVNGGLGLLVRWTWPS